jgi:sulfite exporter TauE/SafE
VISQITDRKRQGYSSPLFIGVFSGFIFGCGPLQAMYVMAAGNGDAFQGFVHLALFGLGTLPALFSFGLVSHLFTKTMTRRFLQASGIILIVLGSIMLYRGIIRSGSGNKPESGVVKSCCRPSQVSFEKKE